jgi:Sulfotransferase family
VIRPIFDVDPDPSVAVLVAGTGRSGTAWVSNIINYANEYRYLLEPFQPYRTEEISNFKQRQYMRPDNTDPAFVLPARLVLSGAIHNPWVDRYNRRWISRRRVIPEIRANLMLKWLRDRFPKTRIIWLLRHPIADANSRLRLGWKNHLDELLSQETLVDDHIGPLRREIMSAQTEFERQLFLWCIENFVPLRQLAPGDVHVAFYENFCERPKFEIDRLFHYLERPYTRAIFNQLCRPDLLNRDETQAVRRHDLVDSWRAQILPYQVERALEILGMFGLDVLYGEDAMPKRLNPWAAQPSAHEATHA